ncbi:hypothetical protein GCM10010106_12800 [Thermopolyspora flexuosa]|jgi:hypothetical protein|uniref:Uncharacterized protein DUF742 n=1 Tax=Thermopolyspora flexuosa TaxID=103836 RepID=A0A543IQ84_9ACTN|nr:DUF742 domain-containing protein [Thermopolyspora flexuosa]TQM72741.1 uncharacterized protein DUF742 [Thermopolyspora flexuosa]GGM68279.1 hypothetical protein GCM10010106_12800 [Thermopolyspora flexuosa]
MTQERWLDEDAGPVVPAYLLTRGRTQSSSKEIDLVAVIVTEGGITPPAGLGPEHLIILHRCTRPTALVDVAAELDLPIGVVRVLVGDLHEQGLVRVRRPSPAARTPNEGLLREVINGLRAL